MKITTFRKDYLPQMAALFVQNFHNLRRAFPIIPDRMENTDVVVDMLGSLFDTCPGVIAVEGGSVVGYMGWYVVDRFRRTDRCAYCPEWGHAAAEGLKSKVYRLMYRAAAKQWLDAGCRIHALTLLAQDSTTEKVWFWNGFGLIVVDAIRSIEPLGIALPNNATVRKATLDDVDALAILDVEHQHHYTEPPVLMQTNEAQSATDLTRFLSTPNNSIWVATDSNSSDYLGFIRFDSNNEDTVAIVSAPDQVSITGAYVRPQYRRHKVAVAILDMGLQYYAASGYKRCTVNFESFNPEATSFWLKFFEPVCLSVIRVPEWRPQAG